MSSPPLTARAVFLRSAAHPGRFLPPLTARAVFLRSAAHPGRFLLPLLAASPRRRPIAPASCSSSPPPCFGRSTRRAVSVAALLLLGGSSAHLYPADAANPFDKYVKRKKLEPLEVYVPAVLLTQAQIKDLVKFLALDEPKYNESRSLLRAGPAASLRINIRAVAQYATDNGKGKVASEAVDQCLRALEDLDSLLLHASRKDPGASVESMKNQINIALGALDNLLQTVPSAVLERGKVIADAYMTPSNEGSKLEELNPEVRQLEALL